jgi:hypothetical protein
MRIAFLQMATACALAACAGGRPAVPPHSDFSPGRDAPSGPPPAFSQLDDNDDGRISRFEAMELPALLASFDSADQDGDGRLDPVELERAAARSDLGDL